MKIKLSIYKNGEWKELPVYNRVEIDERLDEELDGGSVQTINTTDVAFDDYSYYKLEQQYGDGNRSDYFLGFDTVEKRGKDYYIHTIELVEPVRVLMGIPIDGCKVTQPLEEGKKINLQTVTSMLLSDKATLKGYGSDWEERFVLSPINGGSLLANVISPEFHWECGTLLWECLCDIGNVINCIPTVTIRVEADKFVFKVDFAMVNDETGEYEI